MLLVLPIPFQRRRQALIERDRGVYSRALASFEISGQRRGVLPAARPTGASSISRPAILASAAGEIGDGDLVRGADVVDAEVLALLAHDHHAGHQIVDVAEAARLLAAALDRERQHAVSDAARDGVLQAQRELRNDVLEAHVRAVDVVRPEDQHALELLAAVVDRHQLADDLAAAVGKPRVERIGNDAAARSRRSAPAAASGRPRSSTRAPACRRRARGRRR